MGSWSFLPFFVLVVPLHFEGFGYRCVFQGLFNSGRREVEWTDPNVAEHCAAGNMNPSGITLKADMAFMVFRAKHFGHFFAVDIHLYEGIKRDDLHAVPAFNRLGPDAFSKTDNASRTIHYIVEVENLDLVAGAFRIVLSAFLITDDHAAVCRVGDHLEFEKQFEIFPRMPGDQVTASRGVRPLMADDNAILHLPDGGPCGGESPQVAAVEYGEMGVGSCCAASNA